MSSTAKRRVNWMAQFENLVTAAMPLETGRIDWNSATYHFNDGKTPGLAADTYVAWRKREVVRS